MKVLLALAVLAVGGFWLFGVHSLIVDTAAGLLAAYFISKHERA